MVRLTRRGQLTLIIVPALLGFGISTAIATNIPSSTEIQLEDVQPAIDLDALAVTREGARKVAREKMAEFGWTSKEQWICLGNMWGKESAWNYQASSPTNDHGIPQRNMPNHSKEEVQKFLNDPVGQIEWGLGYIESRYGSPCKAWQFWLKNRWY